MNDANGLNGKYLPIQSICLYEVGIVNLVNILRVPNIANVCVKFPDVEPFLISQEIYGASVFRANLLGQPQRGYSALYVRTYYIDRSNRGSVRETQKK